MTDLRSWKLIHDPFLKKGLQKLVRYDGVVPGNPAYNVHHLSDPRTLVPSRHSWGGREPLDIPIPPFQIDENYVCPPPPREVSFTDLNDNISPAFLAELCRKCGEYDDLKIFYHPVDKRHLGIGRVVFKKMKYASICIEKYDGKPIMGKCLRVFLDPFGKKVKKLEQELSTDEPSAGTSAKENISASKRCQNAVSTAAPPLQASETPSIATPQCVTTVPEDPMSSQQSSSYPPQVYPNCLPPSSMPPYPWPVPQNYWPQGAQWPQPPWPVPFPPTFPPTFPPYPQQQLQEVGHNVWQPDAETQQQSDDYNSVDKKGKETRKSFDNKHNRDRDRGRSMDFRKNQRRNRTPEPRPPSSTTSSKSRDRHESDRKDRSDGMRDAIDKHAQRFVNKMSRRSPSPRRRSSLERKHSPTIRKHSPSDRKYSPSDRKHSPSDRKPSPIDRKHSPSDRGDRRNKRRDDRSSSIRRDRDDSVERHRHRSRTPPPKKLGNKLYHWHNRMHSSPIVAKYESYSYGNRNAKESKKRNDDLRRRGGEKLCFNKIKTENDSDPENRRHKNEHEPIVEYEEEYYRRKKLAPPSFEQSSGNTDKRTIIDKEQHVNIPSTSTNFVDEIEEYKFVSRKLCQRVAYSVNENDGKIAGVDKLEVISSTEDEDEEIRYSNSKNYMSSKIGRKNSDRRPCSSNSSNNSSVHLQYSSLSEGESANEPHVKHRHKRVDQRSTKNFPHLEQVSSLERDDVSDISSSSSPVARSRRRNRTRKHRDEPKHIVREVFKEKRADLRTISRKNKLSSEDGTGSGTPLVDEPLPNFKKTIAGDGKKLDSVRPSSTLEKRIQTMLRGDGKISTDGYGTPLQDEPLIDEKTTATSNIADKNETNDDDDRMSLSSGQSRPTSRNEDGGVDQSQKSSIISAVPTMAMPAYGGYPPNYNPYDPIHYAAMMYNMVNPYSMPPGAQQFPPQMQMWPQNFPPYSQTPCEIVKPVGVSIDFNDPQVIKRLTNKTCVDIVKDLKAVLHKDISKRLIENSAFQILDSWFSKQDKVNEILKPKNESEDKQMPISSTHAALTTNVTTSLSRLFVNDTNNGLTGSNSGSDLTRLFGFGLRATLPKLPSFKRKVPPPQPPQRRHRDDNRSARNRKRIPSASSSSSSRSRSDDSSDKSDDDDEEEEGRKSRTSQSSIEDNDPKKLQLKECVVVVSSDSDDGDESTQASAVRDTKLLKISSDESGKSSDSDESDDENENKSSSDVNSDESSSSNSSGDDSDNESSEHDVENEKEGESVKKLNDRVQKNPSFEHSFVDRSPTSLGVYGENLDDKENLIVEKNSSKEMRRIDEDSVECMTVDDTDHYRPTVYDHCYFYPSVAEENLPNKNQEQPITVAKTMLKKNPVKRGRPANKEKVSDLLKLKRAALVLDRTESVDLNLSKKISSKTRTVPPPAVAAKREILFKPRDALGETKVLFDFLTNGIDEEDVNYLKRAYDAMLAESIVEPYLKSSHWTSHVPTVSSPAKKRRIAAADDFHVHTTGCARSEGFYRPSGKIKRTFTKATRQANDDAVLPPSLHAGDQAAKQQAQLSREARSNQRRLLTTLGDADFLKFNQLKYRKKLIRFSRSNIHGWGLFALEDIGQDEMIIEYVGEKVRLNVAEKRERNYEKKGIGSSYLFRIDNEMVIDATKRGAVARFINHSCNPSCYAKIISLDGEKRIVIYSKQLIAKGEEITYDYKFPFEDVKIPCNCGAHNCRGSLN